MTCIWCCYSHNQSKTPINESNSSNVRNTRAMGAARGELSAEIYRKWFDPRDAINYNISKCREKPGPFFLIFEPQTFYSHMKGGETGGRSAAPGDDVMLFSTTCMLIASVSALLSAVLLPSWSRGDPSEAVSVGLPLVQVLQMDVGESHWSLSAMTGWRGYFTYFLLQRRNTSGPGRRIQP